MKMPVQQSEREPILINNGFLFHGQESLDNHEIDITKHCYFGRQNNISIIPNIIHKSNVKSIRKSHV